MTRARVLVVEDEAPIREGLHELLSHHGYAVEAVADGEQGLERALSGEHRLLLLDVMLPGVDGFTICRRAREAQARLAICMLTAKGAEGDVLEGFAAGADDYVCKPFSIAQLLARVEALLRRSGSRPDARFTVGPIVVDGERLQAELAEQRAGLTSRDVAVLACLAAEPGRVVVRSDLLSEVWGYAHPDGVETRCVDMHLVKLRRKLAAGLGAVGEGLIETVRGEGYRISGGT